MYVSKHENSVDFCHQYLCELATHNKNIIIKSLKLISADEQEPKISH